MLSLLTEKNGAILLVIVLSFFILFLKLVVLLNKNRTEKYKLYPPPVPSGCWPIIGHLPILNVGDTINFAHTLSKLADKYGPVFTLRLGPLTAVVVSSREAVMECFTVNDKSFLNRRKSAFGEHLVYDHASFAFCNDGPYWREMRKLVKSELLSHQRLEAMRNLRMSEIQTSIRELYMEIIGTRGKPKLVAICRWTEQVVINVLVKSIAGKRPYDVLGEEDRDVEGFRKLFKELTHISGPNFNPFLKWFDFQGRIKRMKRASREIDTIFEKWIDEHVERRSSMKSEEQEEEEQDFIDVLLSRIDDDNDKCMINYGFSKLTIIKATLVSMVIGVFDPLPSYLTWFLALVINDKSVMKLAKEEIDTKIGKQRWVEESDIVNSKLPYLQAIIKETLRLYPPLPLSIPHQAAQDCRLSGYLIPKGTLLFTNIMKLHRDPKYWPDPDKFMPERFMNAKVDVFGQQFEFIPFGTGRRMCVGITFSMQFTSLMLARLIQGFDFVTPGDQPLDMKEGVLGITRTRANPVEVFVTPRLNSQLYI